MIHWSIRTATASLISSFEGSFVTLVNDAPPPPSFIRRRIALVAFKQNYPDTAAIGDQFIDGEIDQQIRLLKQKNRNGASTANDDVHLECLIRSNFDQDQALDKLIYNPPNLVGYPILDPLASIDPL